MICYTTRDKVLILKHYVQGYTTQLHLTTSADARVPLPRTLFSQQKHPIPPRSPRHTTSQQGPALTCVAGLSSISASRAMVEKTQVLPVPDLACTMRSARSRHRSQGGRRRPPAPRPPPNPRPARRSPSPQRPNGIAFSCTGEGLWNPAASSPASTGSDSSRDPKSDGPPGTATSRVRVRSLPPAASAGAAILGARSGRAASRERRPQNMAARGRPGAGGAEPGPQGQSGLGWGLSRRLCALP